MATNKAKKAPSAPVYMTQEQVDLARRGGSAKVFEAMAELAKTKKSPRKPAKSPKRK